MPGRSPIARLAGAARASLVLVAGLGLAPRAAGAEPPPADPITLDFGARAGFGYRFSDGAYPITGRYGGVVGASIAVSPSHSYAVGLGYEHSLLGSEHGRDSVSDVELTRTLDVVWASVRLAFLRTDRVLLLAQLGPGLAFQREDVSALVFKSAAPFKCQESAPGLGLRAGLGVEARLSRALWATLDAVVDNLRLSSDPLGDCAPGAGSTSLVGLRLGLTYRLDVTRALR